MSPERPERPNPSDRPGQPTQPVPPADVPPALRVAWEGCDPAGPGLWRARFRLANDGAEPVRVESAWLPHGRFRGTAGPVAAPLLLPPDAQAPLDLEAACEEPPGTVFKNAFLILVVLVPRGGRGADRQRVFARFTVEVGTGGGPRLRLEALTAQAVGFAAGAGDRPPNPAAEAEPGPGR